MPTESPTRFVMVPARRSSEPTARKRARRVLGALFLASSLSIVAVLVSLADGQDGADLSGIEPQGRELAATAAVNHLAGVAQNVPHAASFDPEDVAGAARDAFSGRQGVPLSYRSLSWVGFSPQSFGSEEAGFTEFEVHHFLVALTDPPPADADADADPPRPSPGPPSPSRTAPPSPEAGTVPVSPGGTVSAPATGPPAPSPAQTPTPDPTGGDVRTPPANMLRLDVPVLITAQGPRLAAAPAFAVWEGGAGAPEGEGDYTNYGNLLADVSAPVETQIAAWAQAYVTGDSNALLTLTGDQDSSHYYIGLSGFTLPDSPSAVRIQSAIRGSEGRLIVRVRVLLSRAVPGGPSDGRTDGTPDGAPADTARQFAGYADFDLLVGAPTGARPPVLAWGPAGSAAELEPYHNALTRP